MLEYPSADDYEGKKRLHSPGPCVIPWAFHEHFSFFEEIYSVIGVEW